MTVKKGLQVTAAVLGVLLFAVAASLIWELFTYVNAVPDVTVNGPVHAVSGSTLHITELADIETEKAISMSMWFDADDTTPLNAHVTNDSQSLYVGDSEGTLEVTVWARGEMSESREAKVTVIVEAEDAG